MCTMIFISCFLLFLLFQTVVSLWEEKGKLVNDHYELPIPWIRVVNKERQPNVNNNRCQAVDRFQGLKRRLLKDGDLKKGYVKGIETLLGKGYAESVPITSLSRDDGIVFYLPHHPVQSPNKDKIRIVFDCSAKYKGASLNDQVFQGPDLVNKLTTVLLRFREHEVAVVGDVEAVYHQVKVPDYDRDMLRFLWPKNNDLEAELLEYRMTVHLFGGAWSSSAANYSLKRTADDNRKNYPLEAVESVISNFYVDDWLVSKPTSAEATNLINNVTYLLKQGGFKLTKFLSTDKDVLKSVPSDRLADIDLDKHELPQDRALGVKWSTNDDTFYFRPNKLIHPSTRRGIISIISSVYDPLGFVSPVVIVGKMIFQELTKLGLTWDESIPEHIEIKWIKWLEELTTLENMKIPRCIRSRVFQDPVRFQVHHFCDASQSAYGVVTYVRMVDSTNQIHVTLLLSKARLAPVKVMSIPRLELTAAVLAARIDASLRKELEMHIHESFFWTDSQLVIQYIFNEKKRFHVFVANRIAAIHQACNADQWRYIPSEDNPADYLTRGLSPNDIMSSRWLHGPGFLGKLECEWDHFPIEENLPEDDPEIKTNVVTHLVEAQVTYMNDLIVKCSTLHKLKKLVSWILLLKKTLLARCKGVKVEHPELTVDLLKEAEIEVIKYVQFTSWKKEYVALHGGKPVGKSSSLYKLAPVLLNDVICVGGRLQYSDIPSQTKHQILIPRNHALAKLIIREAHDSGHVGTESVLAKIRRKFWILRARPTIRKVLNQCFDCRLRLKKPNTQMMADLPPDRISSNDPPFTNVGTDCFGPLYVKRGRATVKRYGCLFTCLTMRAIHIEVLHSLESTSFINAFQRFISRRGMPKLIRSDNGTNYKGAEKELRRCFEDFNSQKQIKNFMLRNEIKWIFNTPNAPHHGGVWERQIQSIKKTLTAVSGVKLLTMNDEMLTSFLCLVESIINDRPLTHNPDDPRDNEALTPNHLLLLRAGPRALGFFEGTDLYRRQWRQVQWLASIFWKRWLREYVPNLQIRGKCGQSVQNIKVDDLVLLVDEQTPHSVWPMGRVIEAIKGRDNLVRTVKVKTRQNVLTRPITKVVLLENIG